MSETAQVERKWGARTADERRAARRGQIMRAAIAMYGDTGYRTATVKAVCAAAGLTERYFYESFANSEDLLTQCFKQVNADLLVSMREAADPCGAVLERMRSGLLVYLNELRRHRASARLFLIEMANVSPATEAIASASLDEFGALLSEIVSADRGCRGPVPALLLRGVVGGGLHIAQSWVANGFTESVEEVADAALRLYALTLG